MSFIERDYDSRLTFGNKVNPLILLIAVNMIIFVTLAFFKAITTLRMEQGGDVNTLFNNSIFTWFALSPRSNEFFTRPWTIITQGFTQVRLLPVFANMLWLWCFSYIFIDLTGNRKLVPVYIYGTVAAGLAYLLAYNFIPSLKANSSDNYFFGAEAGVLAVCAAATTTTTSYKLFPMIAGGVPGWIVSLIFLALTFASASYNPAIIIAYVAALFLGFLFVFLFRKGYDLSAWMNNLYDRVMNLMNPEKPHIKKQFKETLFYKAPEAPFKKTPNITQQRLDEILDKINQHGYNRLTEEEKEFLKRAAQEDMKF